MKGDFLVRNLNVVDIRAGEIIERQDIVIENGRISFIGDTGSAPADEKLIEVDASGKYAIPGLWDMHTHSTKLAGQYQHPLYLANGVTGVRDMWGCMAEPDSYVACQRDRELWNAALDESIRGR